MTEPIKVTREAGKAPLQKAAGRKCLGGCGTVLSRYNPEKLCGPCARKRKAGKLRVRLNREPKALTAGGATDGGLSCKQCGATILAYRRPRLCLKCRELSRG